MRTTPLALLLLIVVGTPGCPNEGSVEACDALDCNDSDPCTDDACAEGACVHTPLTTSECQCTTVAECTPPIEACDLVECIGGVCRTSVVPGCCFTDTDCPIPADACVEAVCMEESCTEQPIVGCETCLSAAECDDGDACTTDDCGAGACTHTPISGCGVVTDRTFTVTGAPEGMFVIGRNGAPFSSAFLGLAADAAHLIVVGEGASDVNLGTGTVTELFSVWPSYGPECYRAASGDYCGAPGPFGWYVISTGLTTTDASGNATDAAASPRDASGISAEVAYVQADRIRAVRTDGAAGREIPLAAFPSSSFPGTPTSAVYVDADVLLVVFENGELWTATLTPFGGTATPATRIGDLGGAAASLRYLNCTDPGASGERTCIATNFGEDAAHLVELDALGDFHFGPTIDTGAAPVEADIVVSGAGFAIGSAGFDDDVIRVHFYDGTTATLEDEGTFPDCDAPGHVAWIDDTTFAVSCNGSDTVKVLGRGFD